MQRNLKKAGFSQNFVRRLIIYGLMTLILGSAQCAFFPMLDFCPATPDLIMGMLLAIALIDSIKSAAITAVCAGFFMDAIGSVGLAISPVVYFLFVLAVGALSGKVLKSFASFALLLVPTAIYRGAVTLLCYTVKLGANIAISTDTLTGIILPEMITTFLLCLPIYFIVKLCSGAFANHSRFTF